jgi:hypothetical protein
MGKLAMLVGPSGCRKTSLLSVTAGHQATQLHDLTLGLGNYFAVGPGISLPLFTGGRIRSNIAVQTSRQRGAEISYKVADLSLVQVCTTKQPAVTPPQTIKERSKTWERV